MTSIATTDDVGGGGKYLQLDPLNYARPIGLILNIIQYYN